MLLGDLNIDFQNDREHNKARTLTRVVLKSTKFYVDTYFHDSKYPIEITGLSETNSLKSPRSTIHPEVRGANTK